MVYVCLSNTITNRSFEIGLPLASERADILKLLLKDELIDETSHTREKLCQIVAEKTNHYSGSDLEELCRAALMFPIREYAQKKKENSLKNQLLEDEK